MLLIKRWSKDNGDKGGDFITHAISHLEMELPMCGNFSSDVQLTLVDIFILLHSV